MALGLGMGLGLGSTFASAGVGGGTPTASSLTDNFNDNSLDATKWTTGQIFDPTASTTGVTINEAGSETEIQGPASTIATRYSGRISVNSYNITNDAIFAAFKVNGQVSAEVQFLTFANDGNNLIQGVLDGTTCYMQWFVSGSGTTSSTFTRSATTDFWVRLRHVSSDGTFKLDTAPNTASNPPIAGDWTNKLSVSVPAGITPTLGKLAFGGGLYGSVASPTLLKVDGFNTAT